MALRAGQGWVKSSYSNPSQNCVQLRVEPDVDLSGSVWRRSSRSGGDNGSNCVELATRPGVGGVRDSKNVPGPVLLVSGTALAALVAYAAAQPK
jgi:hypothetical protein